MDCTSRKFKVINVGVSTLGFALIGVSLLMELESHGRIDWIERSSIALALGVWGMGQIMFAHKAKQQMAQKTSEG